MDDPIFSLSMQIDGQSFSAQGTKSEVLRLYAEWKALACGLPEDAPIAVPFNSPRIVKH